MTEYVEIAREQSPRGQVVLRARHESDGGPPVLELRVNGVFVVDTQETSSERQLATVALDAVDRAARVLVAGLGLGHTAHAVLDDGRVEHLVVVEVEEALVRWMRDGTVPHGPSYLADARLTVVTADIQSAVAEAAADSYDLVLLDVDNGPAHLVHVDNAAVYGIEFLGAVAGMLRHGGAVVVWSASEAPGLGENLAAVYGTAPPIPVDVRLQDRAERYWLYLSRR